MMVGVDSPRAGLGGGADPGADPGGQRDPAGQLHRRGAARPAGWSRRPGRAPAGRRASRRCWRSTRRAGWCNGCRAGASTTIPQRPEPGRAVRRAADRERRALGSRSLAAVGIDADLAPVADVVPADLGSAQRADRPAAARLRVRHRGRWPPRPPLSCAGWTAAGIATAVKHFPGLGRVRGNTDFVRRVVDRPDHPDGIPALAGFAASDRRRGGHGDGLLGVLQPGSTPTAGRRSRRGASDRCCAAT